MCMNTSYILILFIMMVECNTTLSAYTLYRPLELYCNQPLLDDHRSAFDSTKH